MDERPAHIRRGVSGQGSEPGLKGVDGLDPDRKPVAAHFACDKAGLIENGFGALAPKHDGGRIIAESDERAVRVRDGVLGLAGHEARILVHIAALRPEDLGPEAPHPLPPFAPVFMELGDGLMAVERNEAGGKAVGNGQRIEAREHAGEGLMGKAVEGGDRDCGLAEPWRVAGPKFGDAKERVEIHGARRDGDGGEIAVHAKGEVVDELVIETVLPAVALHAVGAHAPEFQTVAEPVFEIEKDAGETSDLSIAR